MLRIFILLEMKSGKMIKNRDEIISQDELYCDSFFQLARGLMFRSKQNLIMKFPKERRINLHMFFVFFPIDVLVLDSSMKVVEVKKNFKPFTFWNSKKKGKYVVELGFAKDVRVGDN